MISNYKEELFSLLESFKFKKNKNKNLIIFKDENLDIIFIFPEDISFFHIATTRFHLDQRGLMDREDFNRKFQIFDDASEYQRMM